MQQNKIFNMLGLAQKAGKIAAGENQVLNSLQHEKIYLVLAAYDISEQSKKLILNQVQHRKTEFREYGSKLELGLAVGKSQRTVLALTDRNFAAMLIKAIDQEQNQLLTTE